MGSTRFRRLAWIAVLGLASLCQCSLFDLSGLNAAGDGGSIPDDAGSGTDVVGAASVNGGDAVAVDAGVDDGGGPATFDDAAKGGGDAGGLDATNARGIDSGDMDAPSGNGQDAGIATDVGVPDASIATDSGGRDAGVMDAGGGQDAPAPDVGVTVKCIPRVLVPTGAAASSANNANVPANAIDSNFSTRWESTHGVDPQWIDLDFGATVFINRVQIVWQRSCAATYDLQVSNDAQTWITMRSIVGNMTGSMGPSDWTTAVDHPGLAGVGRYVRVFGTVRCTMYGYSMWEMQVSGDPNASCQP